MAGFILIVFCISAGLIVSRRGILPENSYKAINFWVLNFGMPALVIRYLSVVRWEFDLLLPALGPLLAWVGAWLFVKICHRLHPMDRETRTVLLVATGLGNTAFFGYPAVTAFYGPPGMTEAVVYDMVTVAVFCICGVGSILKAASTVEDKNSQREQLDYRRLVRQVFTFPSFVAALVVTATSPFVDYSFIFPFLDLIVPTISPLALFSIGLQFNFKDKSRGAGLMPVFMGLGYKLLLSPLLMLLLAFAMGATGDIGKVSVFMAGMPSHVLVCITASQFNLNPKLCAMLVAISIAGALLSLPVWYFILNLLF
ncbi:MAG: AEC family transporter [Deltaproteobacteria bacterium]|jgi:predicted permease|nr:AEC family transporter [Deltaproteobacteria bacterium]